MKKPTKKIVIFLIAAVEEVKKNIKKIFACTDTTKEKKTDEFRSSQQDYLSS